MPRLKLPTIRPAGALFRSDVDWWHNAILDKGDPSWHVYADGFRQAADTLVEHVTESRSSIDSQIYPILFLYRQYLELSLKSMIFDAEELVGVESSTPFGHRLDVLWGRCRKVLNQLGCSSAELNIIDSSIRQFSAIDPTSEAFRYPTMKDGSPVSHSIERVNVRVLKEEMENAAHILDGLSGGLSAGVDLKREFEGEFVP